jgi:hypothetical protein
MKVKRTVLFLSLALVTMGFAKLSAQTSSIGKPQSTKDAPNPEEIEVSSALPSTSRSIEITEFEFFDSDSNLKNVGFLTFRNQARDPLDSVDLKDVLNYLRLVVPVMQKMEKQEIEMIEIL